MSPRAWAEAPTEQPYVSILATLDNGSEPGRDSRNSLRGADTPPLRRGGRRIIAKARICKDLRQGRAPKFHTTCPGELPLSLSRSLHEYASIIVATAFAKLFLNCRSGLNGSAARHRFRSSTARPHFLFPIEFHFRLGTRLVDPPTRNERRAERRGHEFASRSPTNDELNITDKPKSAFVSPIRSCSD